MGHSHDMIARYRNNRNQLRKIRLFKRRKNIYKIRGEYKRRLSQNKIEFKDATREDIAFVRHEISKTKNRDTIVKLVVLIICIIGAIWMVFK